MIRNLTKIITAVGVILLVNSNLEAQTLPNLSSDQNRKGDLLMTKNILDLKAGFNSNFHFEKSYKEYGSLGRWAVSYERDLVKNNVSNQWWGFKTDARILELSNGTMESRVLMMHQRELNEFIKMKANWGFGYGAGFNPTYMMGFTFDLTKQWHLIHPGRSFLPKVGIRPFSKRNKY